MSNPNNQNDRHNSPAKQDQQGRKSPGQHEQRDDQQRDPGKQQQQDQNGRQQR